MLMLPNRRIRDPYVRWWGRGGAVRLPPIPIRPNQPRAMAIEPNDQGFEATWESIRQLGRCGALEFDDPSTRFSASVTRHFTGSGTTSCHGVYVIRGRSNQVVYVGKAGTIRNDGSFKRQALPGRFKATRGNEAGDQWFERVLTSAGPLRVEYVCLGARPCGPGLAESRLLQAFLNDTGRLPEFNEAF